MRRTSTKSSPVFLPTEILLIIISYSELPDWKHFRLVNKACKSFATSLCFEIVTFDTSQASVHRLDSIASSNHLVRNVQTLILQRPKPMREFYRRDDFEDALDLVDDPKDSSSSYNGGDDQDHTHEDIMSYDEWLQYSKSQKKRIHNGYKKDYDDVYGRINLLLPTLSPHRRGFSYRELLQSMIGSFQMKDDGFSTKLGDTLSKFTEVTTFKHKPAFLSEDRWVTRWGRLRFETVNILDDSYREDCREDDDMDALHLLCALKALRLAKSSLKKLNTIVFHAEGPVFWDALRLRGLWEGHGEVRESRSFSQNAMEPKADGKLIPQDLAQHRKHAKQVSIMENVLRDLTYLDCTVCADAINGDLLKAAGRFFQYLQCCQKLKRVRLTFGKRTCGTFYNPNSEHFPSSMDGPNKLLTLLTNCKPWSNLEELNLEIATTEPILLRFLESFSPTLHYLTLSTVTLALSQGTWDTALPNIATSLTNLRELDLESLSDFSSDGKQRYLFDREAEEWNGKIVHYIDYKDSMISQLLQSKKLPELDPKLFLKEYT
ncbi:hypothetical protein DDE83_001136 [Stemphylium lycopersici]|uniref:F-box domain-containing protein n=1 Tax=Stemphylium lycopersici TaxID=183478 RepID=A0A364NDV7_STELY|nr:hypothetical protein DDE83_001136 [Stemphylium lycopersici]